MHTFRPHQERAMAYALPRSRIFLAMEMRTGKTPVTIRWATARHLRKILVIAPLTTINPGWVEELQEEGIPDARIHILSEIRTSDRLAVVSSLPGWHLINYEYVRTHPEILGCLDPQTDAVVLDESTRIRSPQSQITKCLLKHTHVETRALLSGMPNPESVMDWFTQMVWFKGDLLGTSNYWQFRGRHFYQPPWNPYGWRPKRGTIELIKNEIHPQIFTLTAKDAGMGRVPVYEKRMVEMNARQKRITREIVKEFAYGGVETKWAPVQQVWLARVAGGFNPNGTELISTAKLQALLSILNEELPSKHSQLVVWARFRSEILAIKRFLNARHIRTASMTGSTNRVSRRLRIKRFRKGDYRVLVVQSKLGMFGLNLSTADADVYYSNLWENEVRSQCEKRIEHMKKNEPVLHIDLITRDSTDEEVVPRLREKKRTARSFNLLIQKGMFERWKRLYPLDTV